MAATLSRREWLTSSVAVVPAALGASAVAAEKPATSAYVYCLNTSTIRGQNLPLDQEVAIAAKAGYGAIEPWVNKLQAYQKSGGRLKDIAKQVRDLGMIVPDVIGFFPWIVDDDAARRKGLEEARVAMDLALEVGSQRIAAPPVGATNQTDLNLFKAADRYRALLELGDKVGIVAQVELWGFSRSLSRIGECALVAAESGHPRACVLADIYHIYKGGSPFVGLKQLGPEALQVLHMNDYPAQPPREKIVDAHRVYPGDGVAPFKEIFADLRRIGFRGVLSLELFNPDYWKQDALHVAKTGLEKMRAVVQASAG